jgi:hypothetical protein
MVLHHRSLHRYGVRTAAPVCAHAHTSLASAALKWCQIGEQQVAPTGRRAIGGVQQPHSQPRAIAAAVSARRSAASAATVARAEVARDHRTSNPSGPAGS